MMYCAFCKKQIEDDALFCPYCGKSAPQGDALAELAAAARTGDQDAIGALYEKTYSKVYYTVKSMIKDEDAVFDIVQDTYIKAFTHLDSFQGDTKFLPWVRQIAANTARDWLKKKRPMLFAELNSGDGQDTPVEEQFTDERSGNLPDQIIDQKETKRLVREIIEELPEDQRAVIGMFYYEEMSVKEIAAAMGVSESAVKSRLMYGRNKIEKKVLELEKRGTKLYSLSPLPFLLLLFRSQKAYACEAPDGRILDAVLASRGAGSAAGAGAARGAAATGKAAGAGTAGADTAKAAAGAGTAGTGGAGTAAAAGGLSALKIGLIALAVLAVVGLGAFGAVQIASNSSDPQGSSGGNLVGQKDPTATKEPEASVDPTATKEPEALVDPTTTKEPEATEEPSYPASYIFSDIPLAAYEVTGLGVGLNEEVYAEHVIDPESGYDYGVRPFVKLDPSKTFVLFYLSDGSVIQSPSASSQWKANTYSRAEVEAVFNPLPEIEGYASGFNYFIKSSGYWWNGEGEADTNGEIYDMYSREDGEFGFFEIYHPDAQQDDAIHVLTQPNDYILRYGDDKAQEMIVDMLKSIGATNVQEISVDEALKKFHIAAFKTEHGPEDKESCTSYVIPDDVVWIGADAFWGCSALTSIEIPNGVTKIGSGAFGWCSSLTSIEIPNGVRSIGSNAFLSCSALTSIEIPNSVTEIGNYAFHGCSSLTSIEIPDGVTEIGSSAFFDCSSLTSIKIPDGVTKIGDAAFANCSSLTSIEIPKSVTEIGENAFQNCSSLTSIELPDSVTEIGSGLFIGCSGLTSIGIPKSVTKIGQSAFRGCSALTSIEIPDGVTGIDMETFQGCSALTSIEIPNSVTEIGIRAFAGCSALTSIEIPNSVTKINNYAFEDCSALTSIEIPNSVTMIGSNAFAGCSALTSIEIPKSVTLIGWNAFNGCSALKTIKVPQGMNVSNCGLGEGVQVIYY